MKRLQLILLVIIVPLLFSYDAKHEYYVSVTKIEHSKTHQSLQIISQLFIDDFEKLLRQRYDESLKLAPDNNEEVINEYMSRYLTDKLKINVNGKPVNFVFIGKEYKDDIAYCYLEVENVAKITSIEVVNRALFDVFEEQQNIVRLKLNNKNKSFLLVPDNDKCMLNFD
ncbi:DUF6702 family protein [Winogradskyella pulchriflava]|uniref:DUF6702 family protein n=1 Tax=Winogradskyella pulchriflava TaxID=1110688 RepID=A0ABV6Q6V6_9FLAO